MFQKSIEKGDEFVFHHLFLRRKYRLFCKCQATGHDDPDEIDPSYEQSEEGHDYRY